MEVLKKNMCQQEWKKCINKLCKVYEEDMKVVKEIALTISS